MATTNASKDSVAIAQDDLRIPLIDFSLFTHGTVSEKHDTAQAITQGFQEAGFIYLINHGISPKALQQVFGASSHFFARPQAQKDALAWTTPENYRGYSGEGTEKVSQLADKDAVAALREALPDLKESIEIGRDDEDGYPNRWPDKFDEQGVQFRKTMSDFFLICKQLHIMVMRAIAVGLKLEDETFFDPYCKQGDNTLRLLHYPEVEKKVFRDNASQVRAGEHTDYGTITLLFQDDRGGLQIQSPSGKFVNATPIEGSIVVNAGDLLARWSNDTIKSTMHRVVEPPIPSDSDVHPARYSIAYFCHPDFNQYIDAIPGTYEQVGKKYSGVNSREYLIQRLTATH